MKRRDSGAVLMEFLLVLPIYFALIGGVFQTGELIFARNCALISDRIAATGIGIRHGNEDFSLQICSYLNAFLFGASSDLFATSADKYEYLPHADYSWSQILGASTVVAVPEKMWTASWLQSTEKTFDTEKIYKCPAETIRSRILGSNQPYSSVLIMRTPKGETGYRMKNPGGLCYEEGICPVLSSIWYKYIYSEKYPEYKAYSENDDGYEAKMKKIETSPKGMIKAKTCNEGNTDYNRFPSYVLWGQ